ncbi:hypothetical protein J2W79_005210 [Methylorubrum extorquens]|nr:hypothetical protein [Methylorubrum extorquens]
MKVKAGGDLTIGSITFAPRNARPPVEELGLVRKVTKVSFEDAAVEKNGALNIGQAVAALRAGLRVARAGWNGKGMYLELQVPDAHSKMSLPYVFMFTACKNRVPWLCSQSDLLAQDWEVVS